MKFNYNEEDEFLRLISTNDAVFHYTRRTTALEKILFEDCFKFSSLMNGNDPYEYKSKMIGAVGCGWNDIVEKEIHKTCRMVDKLLLKNTSFLSCCANTIDENNSLINHGCLKSRMWSQYGENHEGICLVFLKEKLLRLIYENYKKDEYLIYNGDVDYRECINDYGGHNSLHINGNTFSDSITPMDIAINHIDRYHEKLLFRKQLDYEDEQEYRIVLLQKKDKIDSVSVPKFDVSKCLVGIILGDRFPDVYKPTIEKICKDMNLLYRNLHWERGQYFLLGKD
ncbi:MAG: DUF2971 domain-containing protein [bacterium]